MLLLGRANPSTLEKLLIFVRGVMNIFLGANPPRYISTNLSVLHVIHLMILKLPLLRTLLTGGSILYLKENIYGIFELRVR